jgi:hypothetical protein
MTAAVFAPPVRARPTLTRVIIAASLGNALLDDFDSAPRTRKKAA